MNSKTNNKSNFSKHMNIPLNNLLWDRLFCIFFLNSKHQQFPESVSFKTFSMNYSNIIIVHMNKHRYLLNKHYFNRLWSLNSFVRQCLHLAKIKSRAETIQMNINKSSWDTINSMDIHWSGISLRVKGSEKAKNCGREATSTNQMCLISTTW